MKNKISVLFPSNKRISSHYTMYPLWMSKFRSQFSFFDNVHSLMRNDKNHKLVILGKYFKDIHPSERINFIKGLRKKYNVLVFFEDNAGCDSEYFDFLPFFDLFFKKQIYKDKSIYFKSIYGNKLFTSYYYDNFGIEMEPLPRNLPQPSNDFQFQKLRLAWNLGMGRYHSDIIFSRRHHFPKLFKWTGSIGVSLLLGKFPFSRKCPIPELSKCQARFDFKPERSSIDYQRKLFLQKINDNPLFLNGKLSIEEYKKELKLVKAVLSPFGFGEICFRDFEAILNGAVLVKPDMSHIETWPNIYQANITYLPVSWDGSDLIEKVSQLMLDEEKMHMLRTNAWNILRNSYAEIDNRILEFIKEINEVEL